MLRHHLTAFLAAALLSLTAHAQTAPKSKQYYMTYTAETWLAQNGQDVWLVSTDLEWPRVLDDCTLLALQAYLSEHLLGVEATSPAEAFARLEQRTGHRITQMPGAPSVKRHYLSCQLSMTHYEPGHYASFFLKASETDGEGRAARATRQWLTYDIVNDRVLTADDVFHEANLSGRYDDTSRIAFETLMAQNAQCNEAEMASIDLRTLPRDFAVEGSVMRFGLGGASDNFSFIAIDHLNQLSLLNRKFLKWLRGDGKPKTAPATVETAPIAAQDYFTGTDSVYTLTDPMPAYPEGRDSLYSFLSHHIALPESRTEAIPQGRIVVSLVVEPSGALSNLAIVRSIDPAIDRAAIDALRSSQPWQPGTVGGKPVRTRITLPIVFRP